MEARLPEGPRLCAVRSLRRSTIETGGSGSTADRGEIVRP
jgi:hypothetical protein